MILESMKMETELAAAMDGTVAAIHVENGQLVGTKQSCSVGTFWGENLPGESLVIDVIRYDEWIEGTVSAVVYCIFDNSLHTFEGSFTMRYQGSY